MPHLKVHEFMCPCCGYINRVSHNVLGDKYKEQATRCASCNSSLEIIVADGIGDEINLIVTSPPDTSSR